MRGRKNLEVLMLDWIDKSDMAVWKKVLAALGVSLFLRTWWIPLVFIAALYAEYTQF